MYCPNCGAPLEEQGKFILGYYQQNAAFYTKKENQSEGK